MASALTSTVVIECPKCGTRYQLAAEAIGAKGRKVACAHCGETWQAKAMPQPAPPPDPDVLDPGAEDVLDAAFTEAESFAADEPAVNDPNEDARLKTIAEIKAAIAPKPKQTEERQPDPVGDQKRRKALYERLAVLSRQSPMAKVRRVVRLIGLSALMSLLVGAIAFRTEIVKQFPDLAGAYEALGLGVNIVGLEFRDVTTLVALRGGNNVMQIDGRIYSVAAQNVAVPPVVITLLDEQGAELYVWSVTPQARELLPGEVVDFSAQLTAPPPGATRVRLRFTDGRARAETAVRPAA